MKITTLTSKGQITLPIEIRELLGVNTGDRIAFEEKQDGEVIVRVVGKVKVSSIRGMFGKTKIQASVEEMNAAVKTKAAERFK
jgi:antitoxin PrlF